jgi:hypothetical protein
MAETVKVQSLRFHVYDGVERPEGTIYEADPALLPTLEGVIPPMARRVPEAETAPPAPPAPKKR